MKKAPLKVLQISDTHLYENSDGALCGQNTDDSLNAVLSDIKNKHWPPDFILVTGDVSQDQSESSYARFKEKFSTLGVPVYCMPGNHDDPVVMNQIFRDEPVEMGRNVVFGNWHFILLDSNIRGSNDGRLSSQEITFLKDSLTHHPDHHVVVSMHHSPILLDSTWIDTMVIENSNELFEVLDKHKNVRSVIWGHVHQEHESERKGVKLIATPSTCVQFQPKKGEFGFTDTPPGYRWLEFYEDGKIKTGVIRANNYKVTVDLESTGY